MFLFDLYNDPVNQNSQNIFYHEDTRLTHMEGGEPLYIFFLERS